LNQIIKMARLVYIEHEESSIGFTVNRKGTGTS
jgi:hypothetical protein